MRRYDDPVEVRRGLVTGAAGSAEAPEQFLWRGRLWKVVDVVAHWVETGPWWQSPGVAAVLGSEQESDPDGDGAVDDAAVARLDPGELLAEREVWRVEAGRGRITGARAADLSGIPGPRSDPGSTPPNTGVFDLVFDWAEGGWVLARCVD